MAILGQDLLFGFLILRTGRCGYGRFGLGHLENGFGLEWLIDVLYYLWSACGAVYSLYKH